MLAMTHLRIHLLGNFWITCDDVPLPAFASPRLQSFLAYLLLHSTAPQPRQQLAFQLWPDSREAQAHSNLRKAIHHLRRALPTPEQFLQIDAQTVQWRPQVVCTVDIHEFAAKLGAADQVDMTDWAGQQAFLEEAVALYGGDLLLGCYDEWIGPERERLRQRFLTTLERLVWLSEDRRDYATAIHYAHQLLQHDPLQESAYHQMMRLHALNDDRAAALQVYHTCVTVLQRELGVEPGEALQQAHAHLLAASVPACLRPATSLAGTIRLVGRQPAWQILRDAWQTARRTRVHFCLIQGEAGIGKTRLAEELLAWAARQGIVTATTRSYAAEGALAYAPVIEWLRTPALESTLATLDTVWLTEVARLLPELLVAHPTLPRPAPLTDQWQRQRLFEALARTFTGDGRSKLLVIDDLQWCDGETLAWLRYLLHFAHSDKGQLHPVTPLLIVGTARSDEIDADHPFTTLLLDLRRNDEITELTLTPLNASETAELAAQVTTTPLTAETAQAVYRQSEGNPLFVVEMVRAGMGDWRQETGGAQTGLQSPISDLPSLPPKVQAVIQQRLNQLTSTARQLLGLAATIGRSFTFAMLLAVGDVPETELVQSLDELWRRGLVRAQGSNRYDFSHDRIREAVYATVSPVQRPLWHKRVAQALEVVYRDDTDEVSGQLAFHYEEAGLFERAVHWYQRAGQAARQLFAHAEAITYLESGLALLDRLPEDHQHTAQKLQLLRMLDEVVVNVYGVAPLRRTVILERVKELAIQLHDNHHLCDVLGNLSFFYQARGELQTARQLAQEHLLLVQQTEDPIQRALAHLRFGTVTMSVGAFQDANHALELARSFLDKCATPLRYEFIWKQQSSHIDRFWLNILWIVGFPERAQDVTQRMLKLAVELGPRDRSNIPFFAAMLYRNLKLKQPLIQQTEQLTQLGQEYSMRLAEQSGTVFQGWILAHQGDLSAGIALTQRGVDSFRRVGQTIFQTHRLAMLAEMHLTANQFQEAQLVLEEAFFISREKGEHFWDVELYRLQGDLCLAQNRADIQAEHAYLQAIVVAQQQSAKSLELRATMALCRLWQRQGKCAEAHALLAAIYGWFTEGFDTADLQEAKALLAELALRQ